MLLKPQDILVLLKLAISEESPSYHTLARELGMSSSEIHKALKRATSARLATRAGNSVRPLRPALVEFLAHGIRYAFAPERGGPTRGMPTASAAPPLDQHLSPPDPPPVWPDPEGSVRGFAFSPLYRSAPQAARNDPALYELLALVDAVRGGDARERKLAIQELTSRLRANS